MKSAVGLVGFHC